MPVFEWKKDTIFDTPEEQALADDYMRLFNEEFENVHSRAMRRYANFMIRGLPMQINVKEILKWY